MEINPSYTGISSQGSAKRSFNPTVLTWAICVMAALFYLYNYLLRILPNVISHGLTDSYQIGSATIVSSFAVIYYGVYVLMQLPAGIMLDRYGPKRILVFACLICGLGMYFFASSTHFATAELSRFFIAFGSAFAFVGALKIATGLLPLEYFGLFSGLVLSFGMVGGLIGDTVIDKLVKSEGWHLTVYAIGALGVLLAGVMYYLLRVKNNPVQKLSGSTDVDTKKHSLALANVYVYLAKIFKSPQIWLSGIIGCLMYLPIPLFIELWSMPYLEQVDGFVPDQAANSVSLIFLGLAIGAPIFGWISDKVKQRRFLLTIGAAIAAILISVLFYVPDLSAKYINVIFFIFGLFLSAQILVFAVCRRASFRRSAGTIIAFINLLIMGGSFILQPITRKLLYFIGGTSINGTYIYSTAAFQIVLAIIPLGLIIAMFLSFFLAEEDHNILVSMKNRASN